MKGLANRHNLSRHKKTCQMQPFHEIGCKRSRDDDETRTLSKNPKIKALADAIINDTPVKDYSNKLPAVGEKKLPTPRHHLWSSRPRFLNSPYST